MKGKILIVDDLADFRKLLRSALEDGNLITEADSKAALEKAFAQEQPDLVLLDVRLPDGNGLELKLRTPLVAPVRRSFSAACHQVAAQPLPG